MSIEEDEKLKEFYRNGTFLDEATVGLSALNDGVMCRCQNIEMGSYGNQIWVHPAAHMPKENGYCLDKCIAEEVMQLWMKGITTTGCCCGHNTEHAYIGVTEGDIPKMKEMGYKTKPNECRPGAEDSFYPQGT